MSKFLIFSFILLGCSFGQNVSTSERPVSGPLLPARRDPCPRVVVTCPDPFDEKAPLQFQASIEGVAANARLKYSWFVSHGRVKTGQGTYSIVVDTLERQGLTATVIVCGLPYECENEALCTTFIAKD